MSQTLDAPSLNKPQKMTLRQTFNAFARLKWQDLVTIGKETLKDLRRPSEIFMLAAGAIVPGGFIAYAAYRIIKHQKAYSSVG